MPFFEQYGNYILWALAVVILGATGATVWWRSASARAAAGWTELASAAAPADFARVADSFADSPVGAWARLREGESLLESGIRLMFEDRAAALADLTKARDSFEKLLNLPGTPGEIRMKGLYGLARTLETLSDGDTAPAIAAYEKLLREFPGSVYEETARRQIAALKSDELKQFYAWFHAQNPKPPDRKEPQDGETSVRDPLSSTDSTSEAGVLPRIPPLLQLPPQADQPAVPANEQAPPAEGSNAGQP